VGLIGLVAGRGISLY